MPKAPAPASATLIVLLIAVLQDQVADRGVDCRHVVEAVHDLGRRAACDVAHRAARDQPHHELDALASPPRARTRCAASARRPSGSSISRSRKRVVPLAVDQAGARPLQLVAHAAGAPDLHVRAARRSVSTARRIAWPSWKQRRPDGTGYCTTLTANGITGHGQACRAGRTSATAARCRPWSTSILLTMVRSKSSWITDCAMCAASSGWPIDLGHRARAPAFVGGLELGGGADREGRDHLQAERGGVVVVDEEDDVGLVVLHPLLRELVALEHAAASTARWSCPGRSPRRSPARARCRRRR